MAESQKGPDSKDGNEDIDSKIADFMADIDEIVLGKNINPETSQWTQCFDETSQSIYYWNTKTNECSWDRPSTSTDTPSKTDDNTRKKRLQTSNDHLSPKKVKKPSLISEYASSASETSDEEKTVDEIDELLNEVLDKPGATSSSAPPVDLYPLFEADYRAAIARLTSLGDQTAEIFTLRVQLETRLEDGLAGHLSKAYAVNKLDEALIQIEDMEKTSVSSIPIPVIPEISQSSLTSNDMALLLSLPPPPPPPSPPPASMVDDDPALQLFYAQLNAEPPEMEKSSAPSKAEQQHQPANHHHHHKEKKSKPLKNLPTDLIQKWTHAQQELRGIGDPNEP